MLRARGLYKTLKSEAVYTYGRCYQFAKILQEIFGGEVYQGEDKGHCFTKIDGEFYDIYGDSKKRYSKDDYSKALLLTEEDEIVWDANHHSTTVKEFQKNYVRDR